MSKIGQSATTYGDADMRFEEPVNHWVAGFPHPRVVQQGPSVPHVSHEEIDTGIARGRALHGEFCRRAAKALLVRPLALALHSARRLAAALVRAFKAERARLATSRSLSALDDRMLRDIGIDRSDIAYIAASLARVKTRTPLSVVASVEPIVPEEFVRHLRAA
jgi:uncharacterized protein YjiS (DUF1127 family)